jgi:hypothetical protein
MGLREPIYTKAENALSAALALIASLLGGLVSRYAVPPIGYPKRFDRTIGILEHFHRKCKVVVFVGVVSM